MTCAPDRSMHTAVHVLDENKLGTLILLLSYTIEPACVYAHGTRESRAAAACGSLQGFKKKTPIFFFFCKNLEVEDAMAAPNARAQNKA